MTTRKKHLKFSSSAKGEKSKLVEIWLFPESELD
jgi:hypothetical protein